MDVFSVFIHNEYAKYTGRGKQRGLALHDSSVAGLSTVSGFYETSYKWF